MRVYNRTFDEMQNDFKKAWEFLVNDYTDKKDHFIWSLGRLEVRNMDGREVLPEFYEKKCTLMAK